jgi:leucyl aminopeptidase
MTIKIKKSSFSIFISLFAFITFSINVFAQNPNKETWITIGNREVESFQIALRNKGMPPARVLEAKEGVSLLKVTEAQIDILTRVMHDEFRKCGGFFAFDTFAEANTFFNETKINNDLLMLPPYTIDNGATVTPMINNLQPAQIMQTITSLSTNFTTRRYTLQSGVDAANWIKNLWQGYAVGRSDVSIQLYSHTGFNQPSVILTITGTTSPNEIVIIGAHEDSINSSGASQPAPGADDDASGVAAMSEVIRVAMAMGYRPAKTVKFMAYAGEEGGLRGSNEIATAYRNSLANVIGVMQLDMTAYKGTPTIDIALMDDFTNLTLTQFTEQLNQVYVGAIIGHTTCGYACSDHASWYNRSYPAVMPAEALFADTNSALHTVNDTIARFNNANHAIKFTKLATAFMGEMAKGSLTSQTKTQFDFDGDGKADQVVYRPSDSVWHTLRSSNSAYSSQQFGIAEDKITPADFDGDGKTDIAVWRPSSGVWYIINSSTGNWTIAQFGLNGDVPVPADFDGDNKADLAIWRPSNGVWYIQRSSAGFSVASFGTNGDTPLTGDFSGDGKSELTVFRSSTGVWYRYNLADNTVAIEQFGLTIDKPTPADFDGDNKTDVAVFRPSEGVWYINRSRDGLLIYPFGTNGDIPIAADYDRDNKADIAVWRPSNGVWYMQRSNTGFQAITFGTNGDKPIPSAFLP